MNFIQFNRNNTIDFIEIWKKLDFNVKSINPYKYLYNIVSVSDFVETLAPVIGFCINTHIKCVTLI